MLTSTIRKKAVRLDILVVYSAYTTRVSLLDTLYSFRNYTNHRIYYLNIRTRKIPWYVQRMQFDLIIFHNLFFSNKFDRERQLAVFKKTYLLRDAKCRKVITPQDEFINSDIVCDFVRKMGVSTIFSVQPELTWSTIYGSLNNVQIINVLTGYLDRRRIKYCAKFFSMDWRRDTLVSYRCIGKPLPWFGRHGYLKQLIAPVFVQAMRREGLNYDISTEDRDAIAGLAWYEFLGSSKYVLGVEGGTSIYDEKGEIKQATDSFTAMFPEANFEEIEEACFPEIDGHFHGFAISPRHLEACLTGTCQILTEGHYNGILKPNVHYIPLAKDFSNITEVICRMREDKDREKIVNNAYRDVVLSGKYDISIFPQTIIGELSSYEERRLSLDYSLFSSVCYYILFAKDKLDGLLAIGWSYIKWLKK